MYNAVYLHPHPVLNLEEEQVYGIGAGLEEALHVQHQEEGADPDPEGSMINGVCDQQHKERGWS